MWKEENKLGGSFFPFNMIAMAAILAAMLFPIFARARESVRVSTCIAELHICGNVLRNYARKHSGEYPTARELPGVLKSIDVPSNHCPIFGYEYHRPLPHARPDFTVLTCKQHGDLIDLHLDDTVHCRRRP